MGHPPRVDDVGTRAVDNARTGRFRTYRGRVKQDPSLHDEQLEDEIELVAELVLAASQTEGRPDASRRIDEVLGLDGDSPAGRREAEARHEPSTTGGGAGASSVSGPVLHPATRHPSVGPSL